MTGIDEFNGDSFFAFAAGPLAAERERLTKRTGAPLVGRAIGLAMSEERIRHEPEFFALPRHDVDGIVEKRARDFRRCFSHENSRARLPLH